MRVAVYYRNNDIRIEERPVPRIRQGELLMRVEASGICGSDVLEWYRVKKAPLVLGHEVAGVVVEVGQGVKNFKVGDRIVASHHVPCNVCYYCLRGNHTTCDTLRKSNFDPGGFSEYIRLPKINVNTGTFLIPDNLSFEEASFHEPLGCVLRAQRIAKFSPGQSMIVLGSGVAGVLNIHLARLSGATKILAVDPVPFRAKAAKRFGADEALTPADDIAGCFRELNQGRLADLVLVCTSKKEAFLKSLELVERGGKILFFAPSEPGVEIPISINELFFKNDITLTTSYGASPYDSWMALEILRSTSIRVKDMITHRLPLEQTGKGFEIVAKAEDSLKVIIEPHK